QFLALLRKKPLPRSSRLIAPSAPSALVALRPPCPCPRDFARRRSSFPLKSVPFPLLARSAYCFLSASTIISLKYSFSFLISSILSFIFLTLFWMMSLTCLPVYILDIVRPPPYCIRLLPWLLPCFHTVGTLLYFLASSFSSSNLIISSNLLMIVLSLSSFLL